MKPQLTIIILIFTLNTLMCKVNAQSLQVSAELKELIGLSINKDHRIIEKNIDKQIAETQKKQSGRHICPSWN